MKNSKSIKTKSERKKFSNKNKRIRILEKCCPEQQNATSDSESDMWIFFFILSR